jgi:hypothetical protein
MVNAFSPEVVGMGLRLGIILRIDTCQKVGRKAWIGLA